MIKKQFSKENYKVTFTLPVDEVGEGKDVRVLGDFNEWEWSQGIPMKFKKNVGYTCDHSFPAAGGTFEFRYLADGTHWINEEGADDYRINAYGTRNCVLNLDSKQSKTEAVEKEPAKGKTTAKAKKAEAKKPAKGTGKGAAKTTATAQSDDLQKIEGVGPKIAELLNQHGITSYQQLATADGATLQEVLTQAGARFRMHNTSTWQEQAKLAAAGKTTELQTLQAELKGGRRKK